MKRNAEYNEQYRRFSVRIEKGLITLILSLFVILLLGEFVYQFEPVRRLFIETEALEGISQLP